MTFCYSALSFHKKDQTYLSSLVTAAGALAAIDASVDNAGSCCDAIDSPLNDRYSCGVEVRSPIEGGLAIERTDARLSYEGVALGGRLSGSGKMDGGGLNGGGIGTACWSIETVLIRWFVLCRYRDSDNALRLRLLETTAVVVQDQIITIIIAKLLYLQSNQAKTFESSKYRSMASKERRVALQIISHSSETSIKTIAH